MNEHEVADMDTAAVSVTLIDLLGPVQRFIDRRDNYHDSETGDFPVLAALYRDINRIVTKSPFPPYQSTKQALEMCEQTQEKLTRLLATMGLIKFKHSRNVVDRVRYTIRRYFRRQELERAKTNYRNAVLLLRDIAME